jgi:hypothetical protein
MRDDEQLLHDARCAVLRSMHRLGGVATTAALASTTGFNGRVLNAAIESLYDDAWLEPDQGTLRALGGVWRLTRERRRAMVEAMP